MSGKPQTAHRRGVAREREARRWLENIGVICQKGAGTAGASDLVGKAMVPVNGELVERTYVIGVKGVRWPDYPRHSPAERCNLLAQAKALGAEAWELLITMGVPAALLRPNPPRGALAAMIRAGKRGGKRTVTFRRIEEEAG